MKLKLLYILLLFSYLGLAKSLKEERSTSNSKLTKFIKANKKTTFLKHNFLNETRSKKKRTYFIPPVANFTISGGYCIGNVVTFTDNSSSSNGDIVSWEWDFGDGTTSRKENPTHSYSDVGNFTISLKVTDIIGETSSITKSFNVKIPKARFISNPTKGQTIPHTVFFTDQSTLPDKWSWNFGDGKTSTAQNPIHAYTAVGDYTVNLTVIDTITGCRDTTTDLVKVVIPKAKIGGSKVFGCGPFTVNFTDASTVAGNDTIDTWLWDFGDGTTSTAQNPTHTYETVGIYDVKLTITTAITGFSRTKTETSFVQVIGPNIDFSTTDATTGCKPLTVNFKDETTFYGPPNSWLWDFGDGNTSNLQNPTHTYRTTGVFDVSLTVSDIDGCTKTQIKTAFINTEETVLPTVQTKDIIVQLDASGNAIITSSDIDNGSTDNCNITSISLDKTTFDCGNIGANTVILTVEDVNGNRASKLATVTIEDNTPPIVVCQDITIELDATGVATITTAEVDKGSTDACGVSSLSLDKTTFDCSNIGANTVTLTVEDVNGNINTCTVTVTVEDVTPSIVVCQDITVQLDATGVATITTADVDNGSVDACGISSLSLDKTTFDCSNIGVNTVTLIVEDINGNTNTCTATVTVEDIVPPTIVCQDITVQLDATGVATITTADIDNGSVDACGIALLSLDKTTFDCTDIGVNTVKLSVEDINGNTSTCNATVKVEDVTPPTIICQNIIVQLNEAGLVTITPADIDNGTTDTCGIASMNLSQTNFNISNVGINTVNLIVTDTSGNTNTCTATVVVEDVTPPMAITRDIETVLDTNGNAVITPEDLNNGSYDASGIASISLNQTNFECPNLTDYTVLLTVTDQNGLSSSAEAIVTFVSDDLDNDFIADVCDDDIDGDGVLNINDNCPTTSNSEQKDLDNNGVGDVCDTSNLLVSNGFSPNGDGVNDEFIVQGLHNYPNNRLEVYNRWGNRVYLSYNYQNNWNGVGNEQRRRLPAGVYFYALTVEGNSRNLKGWVYIIY